MPNKLSTEIIKKAGKCLVQYIQPVNTTIVFRIGKQGFYYSICVQKLVTISQCILFYKKLKESQLFSMIWQRLGVTFTEHLS